jgi:NADPH-dependent curcumin reductase CurA
VPEDKLYLKKAILERRINVRGSQTVVECNLKDVPRVWLRLFEEKNVGKYVTKLD